MNKKIIIITIPILFLIAFLCYLFFSHGVKQQEFNSQLWKTGNIETRGSMVKDLESKKMLIGRSYDEVRIILGNPNQENEKEWSYKVDIGMKWGSEPWLYNFFVHFDENKKVSDTLLMD